MHMHNGKCRRYRPRRSEVVVEACHISQDLVSVTVRGLSLRTSFDVPSAAFHALFEEIPRPEGELPLAMSAPEPPDEVTRDDAPKAKRIRRGRK
jgi:hypothetical protein